MQNQTEYNGYTDEQQKQQYLKTEIINAGYDAGMFSQYLESKKPGMGLDVNLYTWDELYAFVTEFQS